ncbi:phosphate ABC transporter substrate-binding protein PstS [Deferribacter thermophilus]
MKPGELKLTSNVLAKIFLGEIKNWNDPEIVKVNPNVKLPDAKITVVRRSDGSGTTAIFTKYLAEISVDWKNKVGVGKSVNWPVGIGGKGNEGVANYVKRVRNSIGYVEFAYAKNNKLTYVALENKEHNFVIPSFNSFKAAAANANWDKKKGYYLWLVNAPGKDSWPIAGASFILLAKENTEANKRVVKFFDWAFKNGDEIAEKLIYVLLPENLKENIRGFWKEIGIY